MATVFIEKEKVDHVNIKNDTGAALVQNELAVVGPYVAVADEKIAKAAVGSFHVEEGIQVQANDLHATENTFDTSGQAVYLDGSGKLSDTETEAYHLVGYLLKAKDAKGVIVFEKKRYAEVVPATAGGGL